MAEWKGLEPSTFRVTGGRSNQLNYHSKTNFHYWTRTLDLSGEPDRSNQLNYHSMVYCL